MSITRSRLLTRDSRGRVVKDMKTKQKKLHCANWECGVIFPVIHNNSNRVQYTQDEIVGEAEKRTAVIRNYVPVPMVVPGAAYEGREPWLFSL